MSEQRRQAVDASVASFATRLRAEQARAGSPSSRELAVLTRKLGRPYPKTTINDKLNAVSKPDWEFVETFLAACALLRNEPPPSGNQLDSWHQAYLDMLVSLADMRRSQRLAASATRELGASQALTPTSALPSSVLPIPRQLPTNPAHFTGREIELDQLSSLLKRDDPPTPKIAISVDTVVQA